MSITESPLLKILGIILAFSAMPAVSTTAFAAKPYPSKPIRLIIPTMPGGSTDIVGRLIATKLSERLGEQVISDNRGGAGGIIASETAARATPDGHTLLLVSATQTIQPGLQKLRYEPVKSFTPVAKVANALLVLVVHPSVPAKSVKELIEFAKQRPGELIFAGTGIGAHVTMSTELFKIMADIDFRIVQFKSGGPAVIDLLGGHSHAMMATIASVMPHITSGKLRALGSTGSKRSIMLPDTPTIAEAAIPKYEAVQWNGILAPAGTPASIVDRLNREIKVILASDDTKKTFLNAGVEVDYLGPAEFGEFFVREIDQWTSVIKRANITLQEEK